jgi:hypothetical protein
LPLNEARNIIKMIRTRVELPNFTPKGLVEEAVLAHNLRHMDMEQIDSDTAPWPEVVRAILRHLRHGYTDNDERLSSAGYDPGLRDELADSIAKSTFLKFPWLKKDPRPFVTATISPLVFDKASTDFAFMHGIENELVRAIQDLRRQPRTPEVRERIQDLSDTLTNVRAAIAQQSRLFEPARDNTPNSYLAVRSPERLGQYAFNGRDLPENYLDYVGYRCPNCNRAVKKTKQPRNFGQGRKLNAL